MRQMHSFQPISAIPDQVFNIMSQKLGGFGIYCEILDK